MIFTLKRLISNLAVVRIGIAVMFFILHIFGCCLADAQAHPVTIDDIIGVKKVGKLAVSPDGQSVAYLVVQANMKGDSYTVSLVVTSAKSTRVHNEIVRIEAPAQRTPISDIWEDVGSNVTGGIVFVWGQDGKEILYGVPNGNATTLLAYSTETQATRQLASISGAIRELAVVDPNNVEYCLYANQMASPAEGGLQDPAYRYDQSTFHFWDKHPWQDGRQFNGGNRPFFDPDPPMECFRQNVETHVAIAIQRERLAEVGTLHHFDSDVAARFSDRAFRGNRAVSAELSPDGTHVLLGAAIPRQENASFERTDVFWVEPTDGDHQQTKIFEREGHKENDIQSCFWAGDAKAVVCVRNSLDRTKFVRIDISSGNEVSLLDTSWGFNDTEMVLSPDGKYVYATREKPNVPKQLCRIDLQTGDMLLIDNVNQQFEAIQVPPYISVRQLNEFGDELRGYLFFPPGFRGQMRLPFVAIRGQHWDAFCDGGTGVEFPGMVMAMKGYAVLFFEPSSKEYGFSLQGNAAYSELRFKSPLENLRLVIADLAKKGWVDPDRAGIAGLSAGADIVSYAAGFTKTFSIGAATTSEVYAPANYFLLDDEQIDSLFTKRYNLPYPDVDGIRAWQRVSTSLNAPHSNMPLLFQPGDAEAWITISQHIAWKHAGLPVDTYVYPDEGHIKVHPLNRLYVMTRNLQWFDFWLRGVEDPRPEFTDQFKRWEKMRADWNAKQAPHD